MLRSEERSLAGKILFVPKVKYGVAARKLGVPVQAGVFAQG